MSYSLVDSHCHLDCLDLSAWEDGLDGAMRDAQRNGVAHFLCVSIELEKFPQLQSIANRYHNVSISAGVHPSAHPQRNPSVEEISALCSDQHVVAVGESGLDYYYNQGDLDWQRERFRIHVRAARETQKPLIVHSRDAIDDTLAILREERAEEVGGVMHCFVEDWESAQKCMDLNFSISFSGIVSFNSAQSLREVAKRVPLDKLLIETDSPYLAPVPKRGKKNQPAYVKYVAQCIAELREIDIEELAEKTTTNYFRLFPHQ